MKEIALLNESEILDEETFEEIFEEEDAICRERLICDLQDRAKELRIKSKFDGMLRAYRQVVQAQERKSRISQSLDGWTEFSGPYERMACGKWIANDDGVRAPISNPPYEITACYHPILPLVRMRNMETGKEQIRIAYKRKGRWDEITVPKEIVASANKIVSLADYGVSVTSENAKHLVKYLSDVENINDDYIEVEKSSSKLGWHGETFLPYDAGIIYDGEEEFRHLFGSIREHGDRESWLDHARELRRSGRTEIKIAIAASLASVIVSHVGALPFVVDFWSKSGGGKTVLLMVAASIWADPEEHQYIGNFDQTPVGMEVRADLLNSLPMMLDDTSNATRWTKEDFERLIYMLCSGKGKTRSNKNLGMQRERHWRNCTLTNGEKPLSEYVTQGGAINRVIEVLCKEDIFSDPQRTLRIIRNNYGFAGKEFVKVVKGMDKGEIVRAYNDYSKRLFDADKTQKQIAAMAVILTADKIATERIFQDGEALDVDDVQELLVGQAEMSDDERCYRYLLDQIAINSSKFDDLLEVGEHWGMIERVKGTEYTLFVMNALDTLCEKGGFSRRSFLEWASMKGLLLTDGKNKTKVKKFFGRAIRMVWLKTDASEAQIGLDDDQISFVEVENTDEIPF